MRTIFPCCLLRTSKNVGSFKRIGAFSCSSFSRTIVYPFMEILFGLEPVYACLILLFKLRHRGKVQRSLVQDLQVSKVRLLVFS